MISLYAHKFARAASKYRTPLGSISAWPDDDNRCVNIRITSIHPEWQYESFLCVTYNEIQRWLDEDIKVRAYYFIKDALIEILDDCLRKSQC